VLDRYVGPPTSLETSIFNQLWSGPAFTDAASPGQHSYYFRTLAFVPPTPSPKTLRKSGSTQSSASLPRVKGSGERFSPRVLSGCPSSKTQRPCVPPRLAARALSLNPRDGFVNRLLGLPGRNLLRG